MLHEYPSLQHAVNKAIELERKLKEIVSKKRKFPEQADTSHLYHVTQAQDYPQEQYEDAYLEYPHGSMVQVIYETPLNRRNIKETRGCFYCKAGGHFISRCPKKHMDRCVKKERRQQNKQDKVPNT
jgi:hypothetical protein